MKIHWKRVLTAAIWSELLLLAIRIPILRYAGPARHILGRSNWFGSMFLGGLWVTRKIESRFVLHGVLVGVFANILYFFVYPLTALLTQPATTRNEQGSQQLTLLFVSFGVKILGSAAGSYIGGRRRKKLL